MKATKRIIPPSDSSDEDCRPNERVTSAGGEVKVSKSSSSQHQEQSQEKRELAALKEESLGGRGESSSMVPKQPIAKKQKTDDLTFAMKFNAAPASANHQFRQETSDGIDRRFSTSAREELGARLSYFPEDHVHTICRIIQIAQYDADQDVMSLRSLSDNGLDFSETPDDVIQKVLHYVSRVSERAVDKIEVAITKRQLEDKAKASGIVCYDDSSRWIPKNALKNIVDENALPADYASRLSTSFRDASPSSNSKPEDSMSVSKPSPVLIDITTPPHTTPEKKIERSLQDNSKVIKKKLNPNVRYELSVRMSSLPENHMYSCLRIIQIGQHEADEDVMSLRFLCENEIDFHEISDDIIQELLEYISAVDSDEATVAKTMKNLKEKAKSYGISHYDDILDFIPKKALKRASNQNRMSSDSASLLATSFGDTSSSSTSNPKHSSMSVSKNLPIHEAIAAPPRPSFKSRVPSVKAPCSSTSTKASAPAVKTSGVPVQRSRQDNSKVVEKKLRPNARQYISSWIEKLPERHIRSMFRITQIGQHKADQDVFTFLSLNETHDFSQISDDIIQELLDFVKVIERDPGEAARIGRGLEDKANYYGFNFYDSILGFCPKEGLKPFSKRHQSLVKIAPPPAEKTEEEKKAHEEALKKQAAARLLKQNTKEEEGTIHSKYQMMNDFEKYELFSYLNRKPLPREADKEKSEWHIFCDRLLTDIFKAQNNVFAKLFFYPFEPVEFNLLRSYVVKTPMDLRTIRIKLDCYQYMEPNEFAADMNLMLDNYCKNVPDPFVFHQYASKLKVFFDERWKLCPKTVVQYWQQDHSKMMSSSGFVHNSSIMQAKLSGTKRDRMSDETPKEPSVVQSSERSTRSLKNHPTANEDSRSHSSSHYVKSRRH